MTENSKKSTILQAVKAIAVLVIICLVCCLLLSLCNDLLYISDDVRFERSMKAIYPDFVKDESFNGALDTKFSTYSEFGSVNNVFKSTDGSYIIEAKGEGGYQGGSVTLYVIVGADAKIKSWVVKENDKQSYINRVPANAGTTWYVGEDVSNELALNMTGATVKLTSTAINHAVNMAAFYCRNALGLGKNPEVDAKNAVMALLGGDFAGYELESVTKLLSGAVSADGQTVATVLSDGDDAVSYLFSGNGAAGNVLAAVYGTEDSKVVAVTANGVVASENVAADAAIRTKVAKLTVSEVEFGSKKVSVVIFDVASAEGQSVYGVVSYTASGWDPTNYTLQVTVVSDGGKGKVEDIVVIKSGNVMIDINDTDKLAISLKGATSETVMSIYNAEKVSGATQSANIITAAIKVVLENFDAE